MVMLMRFWNYLPLSLLMFLLACSSGSGGSEDWSPCLDDTDCDSNAYCDIQSGICVIDESLCEKDEECPSGYFCNAATRYCEPEQVEGCPAGQVPLEGNCVIPECTLDAHCATNYTCDTDIYRCIPNIQENCVLDSDCDSPMVCKGGRCGYCSQDADCAPDSYCQFSTSELPGCVAIRCGNDNDCREDYWCRTASGRCVPPCTEHSECEDGKLCMDGHCETVEPECESDWDCPEKKLCSEYRLCERGAACRTDAQCGDGRICEETGHFCVPDGCLYDSECDSGMICDPGPHECRYAVYTGSPCGADEQCLASDRCYRSTCVRTCDPYSPECQTSYVCATVTDLESGPAALCVPMEPGESEGASCSEITPCRTGLICHNRKCGRVCDPSLSAEDVCGEGMVCDIDETLQIGVCATPPCDEDTNPCPSGQFCYQGECVTCATNDQCPTKYFCGRGVCQPGCRITGCATAGTWCNRETEQCEEICPVSCEEGYWCREGHCVPRFCDPPCTPPAVCEYGTCVLPPDCRIVDCPDERWICNQENGLCEEPPCPACPEGWCCSELTDYQCSDICYTCSEEEPRGTCPVGRTCEEGYCTDIPCVGQGETCGALASIPGTPCCEGTVCCEIFPGSGGVCCAECGFDGSCVE